MNLVEISDANRESVLALRVASGQEQFVGTVSGALAEAGDLPQAEPWFRAVYIDDVPVGFVMISWNVQPRPPEIVGPWYLWKLIIDERYQRRGYGAAAVGLVAGLVRAEGGTELLTSYVVGEGGPAGFYKRLGFEPTGDMVFDGEVLMRLRLASS